MTGLLEGKVALITGGARGLGRAFCEAFAREGAAVALTDLRVDEGLAVAEALTMAGARALFIEQDVTSEAQWESTIAAVTKAFGPMTILVNNAGIALPATIEDQTYEEWRRTLSVNLDAVFLGTRAGVRHMKQHGGAILNVSSIEGMVGNALVPAYNASKGGVRLLTKSAAIHCAREGYRLRVNSLHPGYVATDMVVDALAQLPEGFAEQTLQRTPMGRFGDAMEIAETAVFLCSDRASYMTGSELVVDGGYLA